MQAISGSSAALGLDSTGAVNNLNDLWKYTPSSGQWTWVGGSNTGGAAGTYGTLGTASPSNAPGAREQMTYWLDQSGRFWMFGGTGAGSTQSTGFLNDLWSYSPSTGLWTWLNGSNTANALPVFGQQGVPSASNVPGSRIYPVSWVDSAGSFWLFGGNGYDSTGSTNDLSDLWNFNPTNNEWAWIGGSQSGGLMARTVLSGSRRRQMPPVPATAPFRGQIVLEIYGCSEEVGRAVLRERSTRLIIERSLGVRHIPISRDDCDLVSEPELGGEWWDFDPRMDFP